MSQGNGARGLAQWRIVYNLLAPMQPDETLSYEVLSEALDTDDMAKIQRLVSKARRELWASHGRSLTALPNRGYRMIRAEEHEGQARGYELAARRRVKDAVAVIQATHLDELSDMTRDLVIKQQMFLGTLARAMDENQRRIAEHDDLIEGLTQRLDRLEHEH